MARITIYLPNGTVFGTLDCAQSYMRELLYRQPIGVPIVGTAASDMHCLMERHRNAEEKIGPGIDHFKVEINGGFTGYKQSRGFHAVRVDGTVTDFSYKAIGTKQPGVGADFTKACRAAVSVRLNEFATAYFAGRDVAPCQLTGEQVARGAHHVHHSNPGFAEIVTRFRAAKGWADSIPASVIHRGGDGQIKTRFADPELGAEFLEFHNNSGTTLQVVSAAAHLSHHHPAPA